MAGTDPLGTAVLASPVLGLAIAGAVHWFSRRKEHLVRRKTVAEKTFFEQNRYPLAGGADRTLGHRDFRLDLLATEF